MKPVPPPIGIAEVPGGFLVSLPPRLALVLSLRASFRRVRAGAEPWTYVVPGPARRLGEWVAEIEVHALAERRRRAWSASDAEWEGASAAPAPPRPADPPFIVTLPEKRTARPLLELLQRLAAGDVLTVEAGRFRLLRSGRPVAAGVAARAIGQRLIVPSCDGLFGPEWSQTWRAPTREEVDAATHAGGDRGLEGGEGRARRRRAETRCLAKGRAGGDPRPLRPKAAAPVADGRGRAPARGGGGVAARFVEGPA